MGRHQLDQSLNAQWVPRLQDTRLHPFTDFDQQPARLKDTFALEPLLHSAGHNVLFSPDL